MCAEVFNSFGFGWMESVDAARSCGSNPSRFFRNGWLVVDEIPLLLYGALSVSLFCKCRKALLCLSLSGLLSVNLILIANFYLECKHDRLHMTIRL